MLVGGGLVEGHVATGKSIQVHCTKVCSDRLVRNDPRAFIILSDRKKLLPYAKCEEVGLLPPL